jgi:hypothetical protein
MVGNTVGDDYSKSTRWASVSGDRVLDGKILN